MLSQETTCSHEKAKRLFRALEWSENSTATPQTVAELKEEYCILPQILPIY